MALEIKQTLRLAQQLVITPQLQQAIKLLQLSRLDLQNLVQHELMENPVLEETEEPGKEEAEEVSVTEPMTLTHEVHDKEQKTAEVGTKDGELKEPTNFDWENYLGTYNAAEPEGGIGRHEMSDEPPSYENKSSPIRNLQDHLLWQLHLSDMSHEEALIAEEIISNINDDGYFQGNTAEMAKSNNCSEEQVQFILKMVQEFDPTGVGARDLVECLLLQIRPFEKDHTLLKTLIEHHLTNLEKRNYHLIAKELNISMDRLRELAHIVGTLEPKPGRPFGGETPNYIIPDVFVEKVGTEYVVLLNDDGLPKLQVSSFYRNALMQNSMPTAAKEYVQDKLRSAMWLIRSIHQRQRTLYKVTQAIVKFQKDFFEKGISHLKPMILRDIADEIQMHESTVSRVTTSKYVQTPRGLFELKFFFNSRVSKSSGDGITSEAVKLSIKHLIERENGGTPLSDQQIAALLKDQDIHISRRTVAKYREAMGIDTSSRRRQAV
ncbi:MAG: RNA polymerase factor sigma-54 [Deltaproteobacteria bacterium]|nr:RNA polymerase factor sigma-54 [Deltaproteobacteria bacterium]